MASAEILWCARSGNNLLDFGLPEAFSAALLGVPGVQSITPEYLLLDLIDFKNDGRSSVLVNGCSPGGATIARLKVLPHDSQFVWGQGRSVMLGFRAGQKTGKESRR